MKKQPSIDHRERVRGWLALGVLALLAIVIVAMVSGIATAKEMAPILGTLVPLVAAALGFYFGGKSSQRDGDRQSDRGGDRDGGRVERAGEQRGEGGD